MVVVFALAAALLYGSADFLGGAASRQTRAMSVVTVSAPVGALAMLVVALVGGGSAQAGGLAWAAAAGAFGGVGLIVFYAGLAAGPMSVVAPVSALVSTVLPVGVALAGGERPGGHVYAGVIACLAAIGLVSSQGARSAKPVTPAAAAGRTGSVGPAGLAPQNQPATVTGQAAAGGDPVVGQPGSHHGRARGLGYGIAAGLSFGIFFVFLRNAGASGVFWPVCVARLAGTSVVLAAAVVFGARPVWRSAGSVWWATVGSGILDAAANICYVLATRAGLFGIAVVLTSLYPGITVLLARVVLGERTRAVQRAGLVLAAAGVALVTV
jgi:drug/metabolite transporter (DMT)-like permease